MKIYIFTSTNEISQKELVKRVADIWKDRNLDARFYLEFPERVDIHPTIMFDDMLNTMKSQIEKDESSAIVTWSADIFNAIRVAIAESENKNIQCKCYQLNASGFVASPILSSGKMEQWEKGCFDTWDNALLRLIK